MATTNAQGRKTKAKSAAASASAQDPDTQGNNAMTEKSTDAPKTAAPAATGQQVKFNTDNLKSSYCNVANATSTIEEVVMNFGINESWDLGRNDVEVQLTHRIIISPFAAKRLNDMLTNLIKEHEKRYGKLS